MIVLFAAIYGYHFCKAAKRGFTLLLSNALRLMALNTVGDFCLFLAKILVVIVVVVLGMQITEVSKSCSFFWFMNIRAPFPFLGSRISDLNSVDRCVINNMVTSPACFVLRNAKIWCCPVLRRQCCSLMVMIFPGSPSLGSDRSAEKF